MLFYSLLVTSSNRAIISLVYFLALQLHILPVLGLLGPHAIEILAPDLFNPLAIGFFAPVSLIFGAHFLAAATMPFDLLTACLFVPDLLHSFAAGIFNLLKTHVADSQVLFSVVFTVCFSDLWSTDSCSAGLIML